MRENFLIKSIKETSETNLDRAELDGKYFNGTRYMTVFQGLLSISHAKDLK